MTKSSAVRNACLAVALGAALLPQVTPGASAIAGYVVTACAFLAVSVSIWEIGLRAPECMSESSLDEVAHNASKVAAQQSPAASHRAVKPSTSSEELDRAEDIVRNHLRFLLSDAQNNLREKNQVRSMLVASQRFTHVFMPSLSFVGAAEAHQRALAERRAARQDQIATVNEIVRAMHADQVTFGTLTVTLREDETIIQITGPKKEQQGQTRKVEGRSEIVRPASTRGVLIH